MTVRRKVKKIGGSLAVIIPRDLAESMGVEEDDDVRLSLIGRQLVVEPEDDTIDDLTFQRSFSAVLRRHGKVFQRLAEFDNGG